MSKRQQLTAGDLTPAPYNPRRISDTQLALLKKSMDRYGDLSGIVVNRRTGHVVGGHQRLKLIPPQAAITIVEELDEPSAVGTVAHGFLALEGELWSYREVDWSEEDEAVANIGANQHGGEFMLPDLSEILSELDANGFDDITLTGFTDAELKRLLGGFDTPDEETGDNVDIDDKYAVLIECKDEMEQTETIDRLLAEGFTCRALIA